MPTPEQLLNDALGVLSDRISFTEGGGPASHTLVVASGLDEPDVPRALARYAVGALAGWVQHDATIAARFAVQGIDRRAEVQLLVDRVIAAPTDATDPQLEQWRQTWRDPWIAELLVHALLVITRTAPTGIVSGAVHAIMAPHPIPKRQGLDALAVYEDNQVAVVAIGEIKASEQNGSDQLTIACDAFDDVERGLAGPDLRDALKLLAPYIPAHLATEIPEEIWRDQRCYLPAIVHEVAFDGSTQRPRLAQLSPVVSRKRLLMLRTSGFRIFFDRVASFMPAATSEVVV